MNKPDDSANQFFVIEQIEMSSESEPEDLEDLDDLNDIKHEEDNLNDLDKIINDVKKDDYIPKAQTNERVTKGPGWKDRLEVVDDFIRNFLIKNQMNRSLEVFQQEWYELSQKGKLATDGMGQVTDVYIQNEKLKEELKYVRGELDKAKIVAENAKSTYDKLRKERDFHKMHHHRVQQEKRKLNHDIDKLKGLHLQYETKYEELSQKYSHAMKEKMLLKLERDRLVAKNEALQRSLQNVEEKINKEKEPGSPTDKLPLVDTKANTKKASTKTNTAFPPDDRPNPYAGTQIEPQNYRNAILNKTFKGHMMAISSMDMHPKKSIVATASDDFTWKIWTLPQGELIMSGEGHKDWVSGIHFHPKGSHLVTSSGDCTIKVWDFINASCTHTFKDHIQPVWGVKFNDTGEFIVSASMDHTCKVFDLASGKTRHTFRGHVDSVNHVSFQPFSNIFTSASADKTISLWDIRSGLCVQTFYGHLNSVNHATFSLKGDSIASCDADGIIKMWDVRMVKGRSQFDAGPYSANAVALDKSGSILLVGSDDQQIRLYNETTQKQEHTLKGHEDAVQDVAFDYNSKMIISCGSDATFRIYQ
ncbi:unnamed protein product [Paramecium octaurelia]|uniref:EML-like second beta-propeller domain-containing protein n=1 Tax=Paramecium octaurelia TaxID=43137 RepID=A0A8S1YPC9_PAROT|nr:unnamed protein product [Paramecium octaurelia]